MTATFSPAASRGDRAMFYRWKLVRMADNPHLLTCTQRAEFSKYLTCHEAARVAFRLVPGSEVYLWDEPNWLPGCTQDHKAVRVVATVAPNGVWTGQNG